jgi:hypothetical protein
VRWSSRSSIARCGCIKSIDYFRKSGIDLDWINAEALRASAGFQRELKETADEMRAQIAGVRKDLEDSVADNATYVDQILSIQCELQTSRQMNTTTLGELSSTKAELSRRIGVERMIREHFLIDANGKEKVCPVLTVDGVLIPLADVYVRWMNGVGNIGQDFQFTCPTTGDLVCIVLCEYGCGFYAFLVCIWQAQLWSVSLAMVSTFNSYAQCRVKSFCFVVLIVS